MLLRTCKENHSPNQVGDITEAACLRTVAIDGERFAAKCLRHKVGDHSSIIDLKTRTIGIKDANQVSVNAIVAVIGHHDSLRETLGLVVNRPWPNRIYIAPIGLDLRVHLRISVTLGSRSMEISSTIFLRKLQRIDRAR